MVHEAALLGHGHSSGATTRGDGSPPRRARERERERGNATTKRATAAERRAEEEEWAVGAAAAAAKRVQEARYLYNSVVRRRGDKAAGRSDGSVRYAHALGTAAAAAAAAARRRRRHGCQRQCVRRRGPRRRAWPHLPPTIQSLPRRLPACRLWTPSCPLPPPHPPPLNAATASLALYCRRGTRSSPPSGAAPRPRLPQIPRPRRR